jgi:trans-aconitate methyltransferase
VSGQTWDAQRYAENGRFVADLATEVVGLLGPKSGERILDLGCGDGALTNRLKNSGAEVIGCDRSPEMLAAAEARGVRTIQADMTSLPFAGEFDAVFSNAALHWTRSQAEVLAGVHRALRPGGRFVAEMGGLGNIASIRTALQAVLQRYGVDAEEHAASFYPSKDEYTALLVEAGFHVDRMALIPRPTRLPGGMEAWLRTFRNGVLQALAEDAREQVVAEVVALLRPVLCDSNGVWWADYVRLRFKAFRD